MAMIRVWAVSDGLVQFRDEAGALVRGRFVAREGVAPYRPLPEGQLVTDHVDVRRDITHGHLSLTAPRVTAQE